MIKWSDVINYEWLYKVSTNWDVKSVNYRWTWQERLFKPWLSKRWYLQVNLTKDWYVKTHYIHRLVMNSFLWDYKYDVNHKDWDKTNNKIANLEYCTNEENIFHREYVLPLKSVLSRRK